MTFGFQPVTLACWLIASTLLSPLPARAQAVTTVTIKNKTMVPLHYKSGSVGGGQESPPPARLLAPGASTTYRLSRYHSVKNAGSATYEDDRGGFGCRFRYEATATDHQRWRFDHTASPSGKARSICEARLLVADTREGSQSLEFSIR